MAILSSIPRRPSKLWYCTKPGPFEWPEEKRALFLCVVPVSNFLRFLVAILKELKQTERRTESEGDRNELLGLLRCYKETIIDTLQKSIAKAQQWKPFEEDINRQFEEQLSEFSELLKKCDTTAAEKPSEISRCSPLQLLYRITFLENGGLNTFGKYKSPYFYQCKLTVVDHFKSRLKKMTDLMDLHLGNYRSHGSRFQASGIPRMFHMHVPEVDNNNNSAVLFMGFTREKWCGTSEQLDDFFYDKRSEMFTTEEKKELKEKRDYFKSLVELELKKGDPSGDKMEDLAHARSRAISCYHRSHYASRSGTGGQNVALQIPEMKERYRCLFCWAIFDFPATHEKDLGGYLLSDECTKMGNKSDERLAIGCAEAMTFILKARHDQNPSQ
ncbi:hypothetical protein MMC28_010922 [Mycoblastus sanguinarius]|nr:hypothetical protein [Mycoblastus sanguinarius]